MLIRLAWPRSPVVPWPERLRALAWLSAARRAPHGSAQAVMALHRPSSTATEHCLTRRHDPVAESRGGRSPHVAIRTAMSGNTRRPLPPNRSTGGCHGPRVKPPLPPLPPLPHRPHATISAHGRRPSPVAGTLEPTGARGCPIAIPVPLRRSGSAARQEPVIGCVRLIVHGHRLGVAGSCPACACVCLLVPTTLAVESASDAPDRRRDVCEN